MNDKVKKWLKYAGIRAIKTVAQTAIATVQSSAVIGSINWIMVITSSLLAGFLSLLSSVRGLPELEEKNTQ